MPPERRDMSDPSTKMRVACIQMRSGLSRRVNIKDAEALIRDAAAQGADFITTPEMTNVVDRHPGRLLTDLPHEADLQEVEAFSGLAEELAIWLLAGSFAVRAETSPKPDQQGKTSSDTGRACNRSYLFGPDGKIKARYDKLHMFDVQLPHGETWRESAVYEAGQTAQMVTMPAANIGLSICYDVRFPGLYRRLAQEGAGILCIPAAFTKQTGQAHWEVLLRARAIECGAFVVAPAQGGTHEDGRQTWGHSMIINPWGDIIAHLDHDEPGVIVADLALDQIETARQRIPNLTLERVPDDITLVL